MQASIHFPTIGSLAQSVCAVYFRMWISLYRIVAGPVDQFASDSGFVREQYLTVIEVGNRGRPNLDAVNCARQVIDGHEIPNAQRPPEQNNAARDEVGNDLLQTRSDAHTEGGDKPLQSGPIQTQKRQTKDNAGPNQDIAKDGDRRVWRAGIEFKTFKNQKSRNVFHLPEVWIWHRRMSARKPQSSGSFDH